MSGSRVARTAEGVPIFRDCRKNARCQLMLRADSVSYTHLDVYKRQQLYCTMLAQPHKFFTETVRHCRTHEGRKQEVVIFNDKGYFLPVNQ